ncbi:hypothetical protein [Rhizobium ruizarguesonis]|jgi:hypothetical protein|uniref:hypothetical protein n=1 Tax=Rhizobium ruizarguesonis TaxID=2081791 RepID=UPI001031B1C1|nr:hypothetical protein [Rhizobium ruizarguesonis]TBC10017.1 hypothetical protein ELH37_13410 [Rhizobium ruizarguesonis]TBC58083.1 hypothetical protein ELH32_13715 [Rhizobium ruizarguesonis]
MRVLSLIPAADPGGGSMKLLAVFDLQLTPDIAIYGMRLLKAPNGQHVSYAPTAHGGRRSVTFARPLAEAITAAALQTLEHDTAHGANSES